MVSFTLFAFPHPRNFSAPRGTLNAAVLLRITNDRDEPPRCPEDKEGCIPVSVLNRCTSPTPLELRLTRQDVGPLYCREGTDTAMHHPGLHHCNSPMPLDDLDNMTSSRLPVLRKPHPMNLSPPQQHSSKVPSTSMKRSLRAPFTRLLQGFLPCIYSRQLDIYGEETSTPEVCGKLTGCRAEAILEISSTDDVDVDSNRPDIGISEKNDELYYEGFSGITYLTPIYEEEETEDASSGEDEQSFWDDESENDAETASDVTFDDGVVLKGGTGVPVDPEGIPRPLLPPISSAHTGRKCLVLDLDETLIHTTFEPTPMTEFMVPVRIDRQWEIACVNKRPGVDKFLKKMGEIYEVVIFTASLSDYASPVIDKLDVHRVISHRLFRESCYRHKGDYIKDLSQLGRPMAEIVLVDNNPSSYHFQPENGVPVKTWTSNPTDRELDSLSGFLTEMSEVSDIRDAIKGKQEFGQQQN